MSYTHCRCLFLYDEFGKVDLKGKKNNESEIV